jgi:hypothetical protein
LVLLIAVALAPRAAWSDPPSGYRCGSNGKAIAGKGCECPAGKVEKRDGDNNATCVPAPVKREPVAPPPPTPWIKVTGEPKGARVWLDGDPVGVVPMTITTSPGGHLVQVDADGITIYDNWFVLPENATTVVAVKPGPPQPPPPTTRSTKPTHCTLGIETERGWDGRKQAEDLNLAKTLTESLRARVRTDRRFLWAGPSGERELAMQKLAARCSDEADACIGAIGKRLGCDALLFGHVGRERNGDYHVTLRTFDVTAGKQTATVTDRIAGGDATVPAKVSTWVRRLYESAYNGVADKVSLVIKANVDSGTLYVDGQVNARIAGGTTTLRGLAPGRHRLAVEAEGYVRWETAVEIKDGETATVEAILTKR